jgi:hypothetical protein
VQERFPVLPVDQQVGPPLSFPMPARYPSGRAGSALDSDVEVELGEEAVGLIGIGMAKECRERSGQARGSRTRSIAQVLRSCKGRGFRGSAGSVSGGGSESLDARRSIMGCEVGCGVVGWVGRGLGGTRPWLVRRSKSRVWGARLNSQTSFGNRPSGGTATRRGSSPSST